MVHQELIFNRLLLLNLKFRNSLHREIPLCILIDSNMAPEDRCKLNKFYLMHCRVYFKKKTAALSFSHFLPCNFSLNSLIGSHNLYIVSDLTFLSLQATNGDVRLKNIKILTFDTAGTK